MNTFSDGLRCIILCLAFGAAFFFPSGAGAEQSIYSTAWLDQRYDWVIHLTPETHKEYLNYTGSRLHPITNVKAYFRVTPRLAPGHVDKTAHYEDLWYHDATPIGCRRYSQLTISNGWQGAVCLDGNDSAMENTGALANAIVRLMLDAALRTGSTTVALVPPGMVQQISNELGRFNFARTDDDTLDTATGIRLLVSSGNPNDRVFLVYKLVH